jgi:acyl carrier protein
MADEKLKQDILATVAEQLGVDVAEVTEEKSFIEDLNADSLDLTEMIMTLEEKFNVEIADEQAEKLKTVGNVISFIQEKKSKAS